MIDLVKFATEPATGGTGTASAAGYSPPVEGKILSVNVAYHENMPASADVALYEEEDPTQEMIIQRLNNNINFRCYPRRPVQTNSNTDITYDGTRKVYDVYVVHGRLKGTLTQANDGSIAIFTVWVER